MVNEGKTAHQILLDTLLQDAKAAVVSRATFEWEQAHKSGPPEVIATEEEKQVIEEIEGLIRAAEDELSHALDEKIIRVGSWVKVIRSAKVPIGTLGKVFWIGESPKHPEWGTRVGIRVDDDPDNVEWLALANVEVDL